MTLAIRPAEPRLYVRLYDATDVRIMAAIANGQTRDKIARDIGTTAAAVGQRLSRLYNRIGAQNGAHAVALMIGAGVIAAPRPDGGSHARP